MNIFKTFEIFLREPLSLIRERFIQIVNVNSSAFAKTDLSVELMDNKAQITIVNSDKMYNLLKTVVYKRSTRDLKNLLDTPAPKQLVLGQLCKRK